MSATNTSPDVELPERVTRIETEQKFIRSDIKTLSDNFSNFVSDYNGAKRDDHFSRKDIMAYCIGAVGVVGSLFAGSMWLINTRVEPVRTSVEQMSTNVNERFRTQVDTTNDRFTNVSETLRALRLEQTEALTIIGDLKVSNGRMTDDILANTKMIDGIKAKGYDAQNARQDAIIDYNSGRILRLEQASERDRDRLLDAIPKSPIH